MPVIGYEETKHVKCETKRSPIPFNTHKVTIEHRSNLWSEGSYGAALRKCLSFAYATHMSAYAHAGGMKCLRYKLSALHRNISLCTRKTKQTPLYNTYTRKAYALCLRHAIALAKFEHQIVGRCLNYLNMTAFRRLVLQTNQGQSWRALNII